MKNQLSKLFLGLLFTSLLFSCSFNDLLKNNNTTVKIVTTQDRTMQDLVNSVDGFRIEVSGPSMEPVSAYFTYGDTLVLVVKAGDDRKFVLTALDNSGKALFQGESTVNLIPDVENTVSITLAKLNGIMTIDLNIGTGVTLGSVEFEDIYITGFPIVGTRQTLSRPNHVFNGKWNSEADGTGSFSIVDNNEGALHFFVNNIEVTNALTTVDMQTTIAETLNKNNLQIIWPTTPITMYAQWEELHTITFDITGDINGNSPPNSISGAEGEVVLLPTPNNLMNEWQDSFVGWNTQLDGRGTSYSLFDFPISIPIPAGGLTLYVEWGGF